MKVGRILRKAGMMSRVPRPIKPRRFNITIRRTSEIRVHEETESELTQTLAEAIGRDSVQRDLIILDSETKVVLDGTHRAAALEMLGCDKVGAWGVSYRSPSIKVSQWTRCIHGLTRIKRIDELFPNLAFTRTHLSSPDGLNPQTLASNSTIQILTRNEWVSLIDRESKDPIRLCEYLGSMEKQLKEKGCKITYHAADNALNLLRARQADMLLVPPILRKDAVVQSAVDGRLLPPKSTKHTFPFRLLGVNIPLMLLKSETPLQSARRKLAQLLKGRQPRFMPPGSIINGRRYEEAVWLYED